MNRKLRFLLPAVIAVGALATLAWVLRDTNFAILNPQGAIANQQRDLIIFAFALCLIVVLPVFFLTFMIAWKYRASNTKAKYTPDWDDNKWIEAIWWGIPCAIILVLGIVTWQTSHSLDPYKPLDSKMKPITVQVVALQWKWLFIYPEQKIASVNLVQFPEDTPINFVITSDAPMNSFWIPSLGGQVYAMSGMSTKLHLSADSTGDYRGSSANISGEGFARMTFTARASSRTDFNAWVKAAQQTGRPLDATEYATLAKPGEIDAPQSYALKDANLYDTIVMKYMMPHGSTDNAPKTEDETQEPAEEHHHMHDMGDM